MGQGADVDTHPAGTHLLVPTEHAKHTSISFFLFNLNHFLTQSLPVAAAWCPKALQPCSLPCLHPPPALEILFIVCGKVYCLEILDFISPPALTDTQGKGGRVVGEVDRAFGFVL